MSDLIDARAFGALEAKVSALETKMVEQSADIKRLLALAEQGRGSLRILLLAAGTVGGIITWAAQMLWLK